MHLNAASTSWFLWDWQPLLFFVTPQFSVLISYIRLATFYFLNKLNVMGLCCCPVGSLSLFNSANRFVVPRQFAEVPLSCAPDRVKQRTSVIGDSISHNVRLTSQVTVYCQSFRHTVEASLRLLASRTGGGEVSHKAPDKVQQKNILDLRETLLVSLNVHMNAAVVTASTWFLHTG